MHIAIIGNGAAGNVLAGLLAQTGESITLVCNDDIHITAINTLGLWIDGVPGRLNARIQATTQLAQRPDICLLDMEVANIGAEVSKYQDLLRDVPVVTLQNNPRAAEYAAAILGKQYILSAMVLFGAATTPGHASYTVAGTMLVGEPFDSTGFAESVVALLNRVVPTMYVDNIHGAHWTRLITSSHHSLAAATGLSPVQAVEDTTLRELSVSIMKEAADTTTAKGIQLLSLPDLPPVNKIISVLHMPSPVSDMIPRLIGKLGREMVVAEALVAELKQGGQTAIEHLNGEIVQLGREIHMATPYNTAMVKIIEQLTATAQFLTPAQLLKTVEVEVYAQPNQQFSPQA